MTRIRQWLVSLALAAVLALSFTSVASADPGDPGNGFSTRGALRATSDPGDPGRIW
jgi:hypothetical protein